MGLKFYIHSAFGIERLSITQRNGAKTKKLGDIEIQALFPVNIVYHIRFFPGTSQHKLFPSHSQHKFSVSFKSHITYIFLS